MSNEIENIEKLFRQKMSNHTVFTPDTEWMALEKKLKFRNFMKFSPYTINIYYSVIVAFMLTASGYAAVTNLKFFRNLHAPANKNHNVYPKKDSIPEKTIDSLQVNDTLRLLKSNRDLKLNSLNAGNVLKKATTPKAEIKTEPEQLSVDTEKSVNSTPVSKSADTTVVAKKPQKKIIKKQVVLKAPTVIVHDTVVKNVK